MKHILKIMSSFLSASLFAGFCTISVLAKNQVPEMVIDVALCQDGSAQITQEFFAVTDEGTEFYLERLDSGYLTITDFSVSDENGYYTVLAEDEWNVDASFEEKAGKCGMRTIDGGKELCWGITEYGQQHYTVKYTLHHLVNAYSDADGFLYRFIDPEQAVFPTDALVMIRRQDGEPLTDEDCDIWAFGFEGQIRFEGGEIVARTENPLEDAANMTIMVGFEKGVFASSHIGEGSFEERKARAFEGSNYDSELTDAELLGLLILLGTVVGGTFLFIIVHLIRQKILRNKLIKEADYFRDAPNGGDLNATYVLGSSLGFFPESGYLGARILRLIVLGSLEPERSGEGKEAVSMRLVREPHNGDKYDEAFYTFLEVAAGEDGILQAKELEKYCRKQNFAKSLDTILRKCEQDGKVSLARMGCFKGAVCGNLTKLTPEGKRQLKELLGLKRYLLDFSLIAERHVDETFLWQEYMVYAMLFGIAKQVMVQLKALYPERLIQIEEYQHYIDNSYRYDYLLYGAVERERRRQREEQRARTAGSGGRASFGGGSGFSGGGGVGTR